MQNGPIEASFLWTADEFVTLQKACRRQVEWRSIRLASGFVMSLFFCSGLGLLFTREGANGPLGPGPRAMGLGLSLLMGYGIYVTFLGRKRIWRRAFRKAEMTQGFGGKTTFIVDDARVEVITPIADSRFVWGLISKVVESRDGFLLYMGNGVHWLPYHAFRIEEDRDRFAELAAAGAKKYVPLGSR